MQIWPLWGFTSGLVIAAGLVGAAAAGVFRAGPDPGISKILLWTGFGLAGLGLAVSLLHLGRISRFLKAVTGLRHSWLSREVIVGAGFVALSFLSALAVENKVTVYWTSTLLSAAAVMGFLTCLSIGFVYRLPGQLSWSGWPQLLAPPVPALVIAAAVAAAWFDPFSTVTVMLFWAALIVDSVLFIIRYAIFVSIGRNRHVLVFPKSVPYVHWLFWGRIAAGNLLAAASMMLQPVLAPVWVMAAVPLDRAVFYMSAAQSTPAAEVSRIREERMRAAAR